MTNKQTRKSSKLDMEPAAKHKPGWEGGGGRNKSTRSVSLMVDSKSKLAGLAPTGYGYSLDGAVDDDHHLGDNNNNSGNSYGEDDDSYDDDNNRRARKSFGGHSVGSSASNQIGKREAPFLFAGILGSILGSLFFSAAILTIKLLPDDHGLAEKTKICCWRGAIMMILCAGAIIKSKCGFLVPRDEIFINVIRSLLGFMGIYMSYISLKYISLGDATALVFSSPVWTSLLSHYILHEPLQWIQLLALPLSLLGIILIAHPSLLVNIEQRTGQLERQPLIDVALDEDNANNLGGFDPALLVAAAGGGSVLQDAAKNASPADTTDTSAGAVATAIVTNLTNAMAANSSGGSSTGTGAMLAELNQDLDIAMNSNEHFDYEHRWKGILIALATSFVVSLVYIVLKFRKSTPIQTTTFWLAFTTFTGSLIISIFVGIGELPKRWDEFALLVMNGTCSWLGQCLLQWALLYEDASVLSVIRTLDVAMSFSLSAIFLDEQILWTSILGASIIAGVVISIMLSSYIQSKLCPPSGHDTDSDTGSRIRNSRPSLSLPAASSSLPAPPQPAPKFSISSSESAMTEFNKRRVSVQFKGLKDTYPGKKSHGHQHPEMLFINTVPSKVATVGA
jgi:drug/metabolite transporter (DMT)-like permease